MPDCKSCKAAREAASVPYSAYEAMSARLTGIIRTVIVGWVVSVVLLAGCFVWYLYQYDFDVTETTTYEYTQDGEGSNIIGDMNEVTYESES